MISPGRRIDGGQFGCTFLEVHLVAFFDDVNSKPIFGDAFEKACRCDKEI